jgi:hypothetical protein
VAQMIPYLSSKTGALSSSSSSTQKKKKMCETEADDCLARGPWPQHSRFQPVGVDAQTVRTKERRQRGRLLRGAIWSLEKRFPVVTKPFLTSPPFLLCHATRAVASPQLSIQAQSSCSVPRLSGRLPPDPLPSLQTGMQPPCLGSYNPS